LPEVDGHSPCSRERESKRNERRPLPQLPEREREPLSCERERESERGGRRPFPQFAKEGER